VWRATQHRKRVSLSASDGSSDGSMARGSTYRGEEVEPVSKHADDAGEPHESIGRRVTQQIVVRHHDALRCLLVVLVALLLL